MKIDPNKRRSEYTPEEREFLDAQVRAMTGFLEADVEKLKDELARGAEGERDRPGRDTDMSVESAVTSPPTSKPARVGVQSVESHSSEVEDG